jgi:hypothetical protein
MLGKTMSNHSCMILGMSILPSSKSPNEKTRSLSIVLCNQPRLMSVIPCIATNYIRWKKPFTQDIRQARIIL